MKRLFSKKPSNSAAVASMSPTDALLAACEAGDAGQVARFLKAGASPEAARNIVGPSGSPEDTALSLAIAASSAGAVRALLQAGANANRAYERLGSSLSPLCDAVAAVEPENAQDAADVVAELIDAGADVNSNLGGATPASITADAETDLWTDAEKAAVAIAQRVRVLEMLSKAGANLNAADTSGNTPLHRAADKGVEAIVACLLKLGATASLTLKDREGCTPADIAKWRARPRIIEMLAAAKK